MPIHEPFKKPNMEELLTNFIVESKGNQSKQDEKINVLTQGLGKVEMQIRQLANEVSQRKQGVFPSMVGEKKEKMRQ